MKTLLRAVAIFAALVASAYAGELKRVYIDNAHDVHVITTSGKDLRLTRTGHQSNALLSSDGETAAWLNDEPPDEEGATSPGASKIFVYRHGRTRSMECSTFIRNFWFLNKGRRIALDCGGSHFAGYEILFDIDTLKEVASFDQAEVPLGKRPWWADDPVEGR